MDSATAVRKRVELELERLQNEPGAHPALLKLRVPVYTCRVKDAIPGETSLAVRWSMEGDGFTKHTSLRQKSESLRLNGAAFPTKSWLDPVESLLVFNLVLKLSTAAPLRHDIDNDFKCVYLGAVCSMNRDEYVYNPFAWEEQSMSNLKVVVAWVSRADGSEINSRHYAEGLKDLRPPDSLLRPQEEDEVRQDSLEIENSQEREMFDYFLQAVEELEPLVDTTQM